MNRKFCLARLLADGRLHSGERLAHELGVTRAAIAKQVKALNELGLSVHALPRAGYQLVHPIELLDAASIRESLSDMAAASLGRLEIFDELPSTNSHLVDAAPLKPGSFAVCLSEFQTAGRGRRGRVWLAPYASGLCLSFGWSFAEPPQPLSAITLAVGVAVLRCLAQFGITNVQLKWPNDLLHADKKLGGILCELKAEAAGPAFCVIGIGLNVRLPEDSQRAITAHGGLSPTDLATVGTVPSRNRLAGALINELISTVLTFASQGFAPFFDEWSAADALRDRPVRLVSASTERFGVARGIDSLGYLRAELDGKIEQIASGDVSLRVPL